MKRRVVVIGGLVLVSLAIVLWAGWRWLMQPSEVTSDALLGALVGRFQQPLEQATQSVEKLRQATGAFREAHQRWPESFAELESFAAAQQLDLALGGFHVEELHARDDGQLEVRYTFSTETAPPTATETASSESGDSGSAALTSEGTLSFSFEDPQEPMAAPSPETADD